MSEIKGCPCCGNETIVDRSPWAVWISCKCGVRLDGSAIHSYIKGRCPPQLEGVEASETLVDNFKYSYRGGTSEVKPTIVCCVGVTEALRAYGLLDKWNKRLGN